MRQIFQRLEKNHYLPSGTAGHGFNGYLDTNIGGSAPFQNLTNLVSVFKEVVANTGDNPNDVMARLDTDVNALDPNRDQDEGVFASTLHVDENWRRFSSRDYIKDTVAVKKPNGAQLYPLTVKLNSLATKILFTKETRLRPKARAVEYLEGTSLYRADPRNTNGAGVKRTAYARKEVIVSGGAFNSPQLLKLSGIGPAAELAQFQIPLVANLPGVGTQLQDNYEIPIVAQASADFTGPSGDGPACTFGAPGDPCIALWEQGQGPYMGFGTLNAILTKTNHSAFNERDMFMVGGNFAIRGFWPPTTQSFFDTPNTFAFSTVKIHTQNRAGTVLLKSSNPLDTPDINFNYFQQGEATDIGALVDTFKRARRILQSVPAPVGPFQYTEPACPGGPAVDGTCNDAADAEYIKNNAFSHHATSTCAIGAATDPNAVLDSKLRVRGVRGLRVVDASSFPRTPGSFPVLPTFMLSERASDFILQDA
jgi:choline dehydrogenase